MIQEVNIEFSNNDYRGDIKNVIYIKLFNDNNIYIGATTNLQQRMKQYKSYLKTGNGQYNDKLFKLMQENPHTTKILYQCDSYEELMELEKDLILKYRNDKNYNVINICDGGIGSKGYHLSEEEKLKRSEMYKGKNNPFYGKSHSEEVKKIISDCNKNNKYRLGKTHTEEAKEKIRQASTGRKHTEEAKKKISEAGKGRIPSEKAIQSLIQRSQKKVVQYDLNGNKIKVWDSITEASNETGASNIYSCCKGIQCQSGGFMWSYENQNLLDNPKNIDFINSKIKKTKPILQYDLDGNLIKEWNSLKEAALSINGDVGNISKVCSGKQKTYKKFIWRYKNEI